MNIEKHRINSIIIFEVTSTELDYIESNSASQKNSSILTIAFSLFSSILLADICGNLPRMNEGVRIILIGVSIISMVVILMKLYEKSKSEKRMEKIIKSIQKRASQ